MTSADAPWPRRTAVLLAALLVGHAMLAYQVRARGIFTTGDDAAYLLLSRELRVFSYREVQFIGEPIAARFPPGYPALLALLAIAGERLWLVSLAGIALSVSGLYALFDVIQRRWSPGLALLVTAVVATNPAYVGNAGAIASEGMFTALVLWTLWAADRTDTGERRSVMAGVAGLLGAMTRSAGVTLPIALGVHWLWRRKYRQVVMLAVASTVTVGAWLAWTAIAPQREFRRSYVDDAVSVRSGDGSLLGTLVNRVSTNVSTYVGQASLSELALPVSKHTQLDNVAWVALLSVLALAGLWSAWTRWNAAVIWFAGYSALLAIWAFTIPRFIQPALPLLIGFVVIGTWTVGARWKWNQSKAGGLPAIAVTAMLAWFGLLGSARLSVEASECDASRPSCAPHESLDFVDAALYAATHTPPTARFVAQKSPTLYYYAPPRQSMFWDEVIAQDSASFVRFLDANRVTYLLLAQGFSDQITLARLATAHCTEFDLVRAFSPETMLLARRSVPSGVDTPACRATARATGRAEKREGIGSVRDVSTP